MRRDTKEAAGVSGLCAIDEITDWRQNMKRWIDYLIIVLVGLVAHGLLLLNDGVYWDGWLLYWQHVKGDSQSLYYLYLWTVGTSRPVDFCFHRVMWCFPGFVLGYKLVAFLSIIFIAILVNKICVKSKLVSRGESLLISVIVLTYPVFHVGVEMSTIIPYLFFYMLFCLAAFLAFKSKETTGTSHYVWRMFSLIIFFISFSLYSLLVFFFGFILILILHERHCHGFSWRQAGFHFLPRHIDYIILPFLFWIVIRKWLFPLSEFYATRSDLLFNLVWPSLKDCFIGFFQYAVCDQWVEASGNLLALPLFMLLILLLAYWAYHAFRMEKFRCFSSENRAWYFIIIGVVIFVAGVFPYVVVGAFPKMYSWDTRHAILLGLPVALIIMGIAKLIFSTKDGVISKFGFMFLSFIIIAFILTNNHNYIARQARWVKDRSMMTNLSKMTIANNIAVFWINDNASFGQRGFWEWSSMFKQAWGNESHIGFSGCFPPTGIANYHMYLDRGYNFNITALDPKGAQAILTILPGPQAKSNFAMVRRYFQCRFFRPELMNDFLAGVTRLHIDITPREGPRRAGW